MSDDEDSVNDGVFHETPLEVQQKINEYLSKNNLTKAAFARTLNITSNALSRFLISPEPRADNQTYEEAYCFFERLRKKNKEPRSSKKRKIDTNGNGGAKNGGGENNNYSSTASTTASTTTNGGGGATNSSTLLLSGAAAAAAAAAAAQEKLQQDEARDAIHNRNVRVVQLLVRHYGLHALLRVEPSYGANIAELLSDYNDLDKRAKAVVSCVFEDLTLLEELLVTIKLDVLTRVYPILAAPSEPKNPFTQCFFELPRNSRNARQIAEAQHRSDVEFYRAFQRLKSDVEQFRIWSTDAAFKTKPTRVYAPLGPPPLGIYYMPETVEPFNSEKRDAERFETEINLDHTDCCHSKMPEYASMYDTKKI